MSAPQILHRIGLLGDIHCEDHFLELAIDFLKQKNPDVIISVGDITDGRGDLNRTCRLLIDNRVLAVRGNHERWFLKAEMRQLPDAQLLSEANPESLDFLSHLPSTIDFETVAGRMLLCHGLGEYDMGGVWPHDVGYALDLNKALQKLIHDGQYRFIVNGHTHRRMVRNIQALTIINAGTLFYLHQPCFSMVDFQERYVQYYDLIENQITDADLIHLFHSGCDEK